MKKKSSNPLYHIVYWALMIILLTIVFGRSWRNNTAAFYFVGILFPIVLGTSYFFNYILVPHFYMKKKYIQFGLYTFYTVVVSLYLEVILIMFAFIYLGNFRMHNLGPHASDTLLLALVMYFLVFLGSFFLMARQIKEKEFLIRQLLLEKEKMERSYLEIMSSRKLVRIPYNEIVFIESLADYIKVNTNSGEIVSKEKISKLSERLPDSFLRIHRSFIINKERINKISYNEIMLDDVCLNIGRSYRKMVRESLKGVNSLPLAEENDHSG